MTGFDLFWALFGPVFVMALLGLGMRLAVSAIDFMAGQLGEEGKAKRKPKDEDYFS